MSVVEWVGLAWLAVTVLGAVAYGTAYACWAAWHPDAARWRREPCAGRRS